MGNMAKPPLYKKCKTVRQAWWHVPIVPATWGVEARGLLEPERWRLQLAVIMPLHSSLGNRARLRLKKRKKRIWSLE